MGRASSLIARPLVRQAISIGVHGHDARQHNLAGRLHLGKWHSKNCLSSNRRVAAYELPKDDNEPAGATLPTSVNIAATRSPAVEDQSNRKDRHSSRKLARASKVPTSRFARLLQYGNLAAGLTAGAAGAALREVFQHQAGGKARSPLMTDQNIQRLVRSLTKMRGAALKVGQFLSIQESHLLPPELEQILTQVQNAADYMPEWQTSQVLASQLGSGWRDRFASFDMIPFAAASIGQVHSATLPEGQRVAVKIQFPGIVDSIDSDLNNIKLILTFSALLPPGLYLDASLRVLRRELAEECDYNREARSILQFKKLLMKHTGFSVPAVFPELSGSRVLTMEMMEGEPLTALMHHPQELRDQIGRLIIDLCLRELFEYRFMQTDPNWSNFLWNNTTGKLELIDFGACQAYSKEFMDAYQAMLFSAIEGDREACAARSREIGYLSENDNQIMVDAHVETMLALAEPFRTGSFSFSQQTITDRVRALIPVMLKHRRQPPPEPTYSLNRKLSGCFLLCARLGSSVPCSTLLANAVQRAK